MASIISAGTTSGTSLNLSGDTSGVLQLASNGSTTAVTIDTSQNVGVGVTPSAWRTTFGQKSIQFGPVGFVYSLSASSTNNQAFFGNNWYLNSAGNGIYINSDYALSYSQSFGIHAWSTAPQGTAGNTATLAERMRIDPSGNLLVGTTSVAGNQQALVVRSADNAGKLTGTFICTSSAGSAYGIAVNYSALAPNTTGSEFYVASDSTNTRFYVNSNGGIGNYSANNVNLSDAREKSNVELAGNYLDKICAIPVKTFNYIDQNFETDDGTTLGVIAQDVQAVAPELVTESNWAKMGEEEKMRLSIYQTDLQYALMKAIQELNAKVEAQALEIQALKGVA
jgi:hypothetical protein